MGSKKSIMLLLAALGVFLLFSSAVSAHEGEDGGYDKMIEVTEVTGAEKNKLVADLLKSDAFKEQKKDMKVKNLHWNGANGIEIEYHSGFDENLIAIPFVTQDRTEESYLLYAFGVFDGPYGKEDAVH